MNLWLKTFSVPMDTLLHITSEGKIKSSCISNTCPQKDVYKTRDLKQTFPTILMLQYLVHN